MIEKELTFPNEFGISLPKEREWKSPLIALEVEDMNTEFLVPQGIEYIQEPELPDEIRKARGDHAIIQVEGSEDTDWENVEFNFNDKFKRISSTVKPYSKYLEGRGNMYVRGLVETPDQFDDFYAYIGIDQRLPELFAHFWNKDKNKGKGGHINEKDPHIIEYNLPEEIDWNSGEESSLKVKGSDILVDGVLPARYHPRGFDLDNKKTNLSVSFKDGMLKLSANIEGFPEESFELEYVVDPSYVLSQVYRSGEGEATPKPEVLNVSKILEPEEFSQVSLILGLSSEVEEVPTYQEVEDYLEKLSKEEYEGIEINANPEEAKEALSNSYTIIPRQFIGLYDISVEDSE